MLGATHACANPVTARYGTTHGDAIAILLPHVVRWNASVVGAAVRRTAALRADAPNAPIAPIAPDAPSSALAVRLSDLAAAGDLPKTLRDAGASSGDLAALAQRGRGAVDRHVQPAAVRCRWSAGDLPMRVLIRFASLLDDLRDHGRRAVVAQQQTSWPQFRANPQLTGVASTPVAPKLKVMWTFDAGEAIESSAAIADGAVYVGSAAGELIALDFQTGAVRWKYRDRRDRRVVSGRRERRRLHRRSHRHLSRRRCENRQGAVDAQDDGRDSIVAGRRGRQGADRILRSVPLRAVGGQGRPSRGRSSFRATCTRRPRSSTAWRTFPDATKRSAAFAWRMGEKC